MNVRLATRGSPLALHQAEMTERALREARADISVERVIRTTVGDRDQSRPLVEIGTVGLFTVEIDRTVREDEADVAVHSLKDCPSVPEPGMVLAATLARACPFDAFVPAEAGMTLDSLPEGAGVATGSLRRKAQLLARRPDLDVRELRGNIDTRLRKRNEDGNSGVLIAEAALRRLGQEVPRQVLTAGEMLPAVCQGIVGLFVREDDGDMLALLGEISDAESRAAADAERAMLAVMEGGCRVPAAGHATVTGDRLEIHGLVAELDGSTVVRGAEDGPVTESAAIGRRLGQKLVATGGAEILRAIRGDLPA